MLTFVNYMETWADTNNDDDESCSDLYLVVRTTPPYTVVTVLSYWPG